MDNQNKVEEKLKKTINITLDMDGRIPINVWTGDWIRVWKRNFN